MRNVRPTEEQMTRVMAGESERVSPGDGSVWVIWRKKHVINLRRVVKEGTISEGQTPGEGTEPGRP